MFVDVAVVAFSIIFSAIIAIVVGSLHEAVVDRRWPADIPISVVVAVVLSVMAGGFFGAGIG